jgi:hypothetical protein
MKEAADRAPLVWAARPRREVGDILRAEAVHLGTPEAILRR